MIMSRSVLRTKNVCTEQICTDNQNAHFIFNNLFFENRAVYDAMRKEKL